MEENEKQINRVLRAVICLFVFVMVLCFFSIREIFLEQKEKEMRWEQNDELKYYHEAIRRNDVKADSISRSYNQIRQGENLPQYNIKFKASYIDSSILGIYKYNWLYKENYGICRFAEQSAYIEGLIFNLSKPEEFVSISISMIGDAYIGSIKGMNGKFRIKMYDM